MGQSEYSVIITQRLFKSGEVGTPIVVALVHHEGDMQYLTDAVNNIEENILRNSDWRPINAYLPKGADRGYMDSNFDELYLFVRQPLSGYNL